MRLILFAIATLLAAPRTYELKNGRWLTGDHFELRTWYSVDGILRSQKPARVDSVIDLGGRFIIPPFGDAHNHMLASPAALDPFRANYLAEGTFYVQVPGNRASTANKVRAAFNSPCTLDVTWANGFLTATLGHGFETSESKAMGIFDLHVALKTRETELKASRIAENDAYWFIDSLADLDAKWPTIVAAHPDFIKITIVYSSDTAARVPWGPPGWYVHGLRPQLVPEIVKRAHAVGLRVAAHVDTGHDFEVAVRAGVDMLAHNAGYGIEPAHEADYRISNEVARLAGARGLVVIPTAAVESDFRAAADTAGLARDLGVQRENLRLLAKYGVRFAVGSDMYGAPARREIDALRTLGVFSDRELLRMWYETTPQTVFPARKIGKFADGYEASFLALERNPFDDFDAVRAIALRFKQGCVISP